MRHPRSGTPSRNMITQALSSSVNISTSRSIPSLASSKEGSSSTRATTCPLATSTSAIDRGCEMVIPPFSRRAGGVDSTRIVRAPFQVSPCRTAAVDRAGNSLYLWPTLASHNRAVPSPPAPRRFTEIGMFAHPVVEVGRKRVGELGELFIETGGIIEYDEVQTPQPFGDRVLVDRPRDDGS